MAYRDIDLSVRCPYCHGTVGVTYDASNVSTGTVTFTNLMLDGEQLSNPNADAPGALAVEPAPCPHPQGKREGG